MKRLVILLIVIFVLFSAAGIVSIEMLGVKERKMVSFERSYAANALSNFIVDMKDADVSIICDENAEGIHVEYVSITGLDDSPTFEQDLGTLTITEKENYFLHIIKLDRSRNSLIIIVPPKHLWDIVATTEIGDISLHKLTADRFKISTVSGSIIADNVIGEIEMRTNRGSISINTSKVEAPITIIGGSGKVELLLPSQGGFIADVVSQTGKYIFDDFSSASFDVESHLVKVLTTSGDISVRAVD